MKGTLGIIGMAVMGQNLALNLMDHGFNVAVFNRTTSKVNDFMDHWIQNKEAGKGVAIPSFTLKEFVDNLNAEPRIILLMIQAGEPIDHMLEELIPLLSTDDIVIDGGNSHYTDTQRRVAAFASKIRFIGCGISGGELGARYGPALMPGGSFSAWQVLKPILQSISARNFRGEPCCQWMGPDASGHFVKMVHNGIEYADMQMISEIFHFSKECLRKSHDEIASWFLEWNSNQDLSSYLIEITANILAYRDEESSKPLVSLIKDTAGQGTGKWTVEAALNLGAPGTLFAEAVFARILSSDKEERLKSRNVFRPEKSELKGNINGFTSQTIGEALLAAKIIAYSQGFALLMRASKKYQFSLSGSTISQVWQGGCIIRSKLLSYFERSSDNEFENLLCCDWAIQKLKTCVPSLRLLIGACVQNGIPVPALSAALSYFDGITTAYLPGVALIQAQRDYFGAHQYELEAAPGTFHHTNWTGNGGGILSSTYQV